MSDTRTFPAGRILICFAVGVATVAGSLAGCGGLMVARGLTQEAAYPLAAASLCLGRLLSGFLLAMLQKEKGLVWGATEGLLFVGALVLVGTLSQSEWAMSQFIRAGLVMMAGMLGGTLGMLRVGRRLH